MRLCGSYRGAESNGNGEQMLRVIDKDHGRHRGVMAGGDDGNRGLIEYR
jgi:hypothetical protein